MNGTNQLIKITLRNPISKTKFLTYTVTPDDTVIGKDWTNALKKLLLEGNQIEKNFCFMGFPHTPRTLEYLCDELNSVVQTINQYDFTLHGLKNYVIEDWFHPNTVRFPDNYPIEDTSAGDSVSNQRIKLGLHPKHTILNRLHNHFEQLQGTVNNLSPYYLAANYETKYAIRQLNNICHEIENLILSQRKHRIAPNWIRPSQITTFLHATRYRLKEEHRQGFINNGYDRKFGYVYMHWTQIGKTLFEVWRDEGAPILTDTVCEAITHLEYYSGEFDIEWAQDVTRESGYPWHELEQSQFNQWLLDNGLNPKDPKLSLGYLPIGKVNLNESFGTEDIPSIWEQLSQHLDIYSIEVDGISRIYDYCWSDSDYKQKQIDILRPGYDYNKEERHHELV